MDIDPTRNTASALGGQSVENPSSDLDREAFMRLLITQIRNQDPMDPMDTREMMSQLSELSSMEQLIGIRQGLGNLEVASASIANAQAGAFVGKTVTADTSTLRADGSGPVEGAFELGDRAAQVTITIRDESGEIVRTVELGDTFAGSRGYTWDGNDAAGDRVPAGRYRVEISATDADGARVSVDTKVRGTVTAVSYEDGFPELILDGVHRVAMGDIREVADGARSGASSTTPSRLAIASYEASRSVSVPTTGASEE